MVAATLLVLVMAIYFTRIVILIIGSDDYEEVVVWIILLGFLLAQDWATRQAYDTNKALFKASGDESVLCREINLQLQHLSPSQFLNPVVMARVCL